MSEKLFPVIDPIATGKNILRLRKERGLTVRDVQRWLGFEAPRAIYKWQKGESLPSLDNLLALSALLKVPMDGIIVAKVLHIASFEPQAIACGSVLFRAKWPHAAARRPFRRHAVALRLEEWNLSKRSSKSRS